MRRMIGWMWVAVGMAGAVMAAQPKAGESFQLAARGKAPVVQPGEPILPKGPNPHKAVVAIGDPAPEFSLPDASGFRHTLTALRGKYVVLEWTEDGCPFIKHLYGEGVMQEYQEELTKRGVVWFSMRSTGKGNNGYVEAKEAEAIAKRQGSRASAVLMDESGTVGRMYGAKVTPHMFMIDPEGKLIYQGAIDDNPYGKMKTREEAYRYLLKCYEAHMAGQPFPYAHTRAYGCSIHYGSAEQKTIGGN